MSVILPVFVFKKVKKIGIRGCPELFYILEILVFDHYEL